MKHITASEAIYGFCGWLTTRKEETIMSSSSNCAPIVELIKEYCEVNNLPEPRKRAYPKNLTAPKLKESSTIK